ncbi:hypothetical protein ACFY30_09125 [Streptomyces sp. NPDC000345]|uniref:hypothetical protein n=1 Tax=Streptomyces sp. NPDC000345 TaxID=3364537 RepID=UPI003694A03F
MNKFRVGGVVVAAAAMIGFAGSPAFAQTNATVYGESARPNCAHSSKGVFKAEGEWFYLTDTCADGWDVVMKVDVAPYEPGDKYDFSIWNTGGNGSTKPVNKAYDEGTGVCIWAGYGEASSGEWAGFGPGSCGVA